MCLLEKGIVCSSIIREYFLLNLLQNMGEMMEPKPTYEDLKNRVHVLESEISRQKYFRDINQALFKISNAVNTVADLDALFGAIHSALSHIIDTSNFYISLYDGSNDSVTFPYFVDTVDDCYPPTIEISKTESLTAEVIRTGRPILITKDQILKQREKTQEKCPAVHHRKFGLVYL